MMLPPLLRPMRTRLSILLICAALGIAAHLLGHDTTGRVLFVIPASIVILSLADEYVLRRRAQAYEDAGMTAEIKAQWAATNNLHDVAQLTARWLRGELGAQPGYYGPVDVDEDDVPGLAELLAKVNEAGFLTTGSQAGFDGLAYRGHWKQFAAVEGLIQGPEARVLRAALDADLEMDLTGKGVVVTVHNGQSWTTFGAKRDDLADAWTGYGICGATAVDQLQYALPVVVYDPEPGRNDRLWDALRTFVDLAAAAKRRDASHPLTGTGDARA